MRMHRFILALSCILTMLTVPISAQDLQKGLETYRSSDYKTALKEWKPLAERRNSKAQYWLCVLYGHGTGVHKNYKWAAKWYKLSTEQGNLDAQSSLGLLYWGWSCFGPLQRVPRDYQEPIKWFKLAAEQGHGYAQNALGTMFMSGYGVPADCVIAHMWFNISAANGKKLVTQLAPQLAGKITFLVTP